MTGRRIPLPRSRSRHRPQCAPLPVPEGRPTGVPVTVRLTSPCQQRKWTVVRWRRSSGAEGPAPRFSSTGCPPSSLPRCGSRWRTSFPRGAHAPSDRGNAVHGAHRTVVVPLVQLAGPDPRRWPGKLRPGRWHRAGPPPPGAGSRPAGAPVRASGQRRQERIGLAHGLRRSSSLSIPRATPPTSSYGGRVVASPRRGRAVAGLQAAESPEPRRQRRHDSRIQAPWPPTAGTTGSDPHVRGRTP